MWVYGDRLSDSVLNFSFVSSNASNLKHIQMLNYIDDATMAQVTIP